MNIKIIKSSRWLYRVSLNGQFLTNKPMPLIDANALAQRAKTWKKTK